jgi:hypothetical protein
MGENQATDLVWEWWDPCRVSHSCGLLIVVPLFANVTVLYLFFSSFRLVEPKNFQSKFKRAEEQAMRLSLPGAHSSGMGEVGENIPEWIAIFHQFHEHKKSNPSKAVVEEQKRSERRTMQRSIFTPAQPFGNVVSSDQLPNESSTATACHPSTNTLVVNGGNMTVVPVSHSTASGAKKKEFLA